MSRGAVFVRANVGSIGQHRNPFAKLSGDEFMPSVHEARARLAATKRHHPDADTTVLESELAAANAEVFLRRIVKRLTPEQADRLRALLTP
jgi:hypothetical protein